MELWSWPGLTLEVDTIEDLNLIFHIQTYVRLWPLTNYLILIFLSFTNLWTELSKIVCLYFKKSAKYFWYFILFRNIKSGEHFLFSIDFETHYWYILGPIDGTGHNFGKEISIWRPLRVILLISHAKFYLGLNVEAENQIFNGFYCRASASSASLERLLWSCWCCGIYGRCCWCWQIRYVQFLLLFT